MRNKILILAIPAILLLSACQIWHPGGTTYRDKDGQFALQAPKDWMYSPKMGAAFVATKDGVILQQIRVERHELKDPLKNSERTISTTMSPYEIAEVFIDDLNSDRSLHALEITSNQPATLGGHEGFQIAFNFRTEEKLRLTEECWGVVVGEQLWLLRYRAPSRHYFQRDYAKFEKVRKTFEVTQK